MVTGLHFTIPSLPSPPPIFLSSRSALADLSVIRLSPWSNPHIDSHDLSLRLHLHRCRRRIVGIPLTPRFSICASSDSLPVPAKSDGHSSSSAVSISSRKSKYSKPENPQSIPSHPAFAASKIYRRRVRLPDDAGDGEPAGIRLSDNGLSYRIDGAPFEFQYSYTETPKTRPLALRGPAVMPFGPNTMPRPWTGRKPLPSSKKVLPEFDSFNPPPPGKKGVKSVQSPGPFLAGTGPKYSAASREEILGEPLSKEEAAEMVKGCLRARRQLNMGRDGLTHNMLDNIHAHWKRRRVCKIKCKGVCTVDMDNVCQQLEEKVGGKVIYRQGGVVFLFRGRNYNYKTRPRFPLMLWKPITPVYPRLIQRAPEGLTANEADEMRRRGSQLTPLCKLGKNGVYDKLALCIREAFEACDLVRINCKDLHRSDCRKIGAKLKDLVPCVLISFEYEHILLWRGKDWKSIFPQLEDDASVAASGSDAGIVSDEDKLVPSADSTAADSPALVLVSANDETSLLTTSLSPESTNSSDLSVSGSSSTSAEIGRAEKRCLEGLLLLLRQAMAEGSALVLDDKSLDSDSVYRTSLSLARSAPRKPILQSNVLEEPPAKQKREQQVKLDEHELSSAISDSPKHNASVGGKRKHGRRSHGLLLSEVVPRGTLGVDELAKLLT